MADPAINVQTKATVEARRRDEKANMEPIIEECFRGVYEVAGPCKDGREETRDMKVGTINRRRIEPVLLIALLALIGCGDFFVKPNGGGGGGGTTGNYVYIANSATNTVAGYSVGTRSLTAVSGSPLAVGYSPTALVVTPANTFLYVAGPGAIYAYGINSNGSLTASSQGAAVAIVNVVSLDISPDGQWLFALDNTTTVLDQFKINPTTGALTSQPSTPYSVQNAVVAPKMVRVAPTGNFVFVSLGTGGDIVFTLNTTTGAVATSQQLSLGSAQTSDNALAVDSTTSHLYIARSGLNGGLAVYNIGGNGTLTAVTGSPFAAGSQPYGVQLDSTGKYAYVANRGDGTISGYSIGTNASLSPLTGSPYSSGSQVTSLGEDKTQTYILASAFGGAPDLTMYAIDTVNPGQLILATSTATGTDPAGATAIALTH
jgi:6-phosphogluconolactonase